MTDFQTLTAPSGTFTKVARFTRELDHDGVPGPVLDFARLLLLDLIGVGIAATRVDAGRIARDFAAAHWAAGPGAPSARLMLDGRRTSLPGAAYALATQLDNLDAHDGWQPSKGHAGAALLPALVAMAEAVPDLAGREALVALIVGYEVSYRAAWALHATAADYHTSGAWNALGAAAIGARLLGLSDDTYRHALGLAEFHAPRSQMMREIANPTMLHDGTGWGAPTGVSAVLLARAGFTGAPAALVEFDDARFAWDDLGERWITTEQYIKPYPVCRWAHAPIDGALDLRRTHGLTPDDIERIEIRTFAYAAQLWNDVPASSPVAQYALAWPVAAALARGKVTVEEILPQSFSDPAIRRLVAQTDVSVDAACEAAYPARRMASVAIMGRNGRRYESGMREASGGPVPLAGAAEVTAKFRSFSEPVIGRSRAAEIESLALGIDAPGRAFRSLLDAIAPPP
ncbi:MAG: MmgE/PrpD family protein [Hyphomicrobiaceae bacterium]|nr:MmgE/PrpD family protein [Hyphomicrobiaceae bacterium]